MRLGEFVPTGGALDLRPVGEIVLNAEKALMCYRLSLEDLAEVYRAYGPPGYSTHHDGGRGAAKPWPPGDPAEAERLVREALARLTPRRAA